MTDFTVQREGFNFLLTANNTGAAEHIQDNVAEDAQWLGPNTVWVEHRYIVDLVEALRDEGFTVS